MDFNLQCVPCSYQFEKFGTCTFSYLVHAQFQLLKMEKENIINNQCGGGKNMNFYSFVNERRCITFGGFLSLHKLFLGRPIQKLPVPIIGNVQQHCIDRALKISSSKIFFSVRWALLSHSKFRIKRAANQICVIQLTTLKWNQI